MLFTHNETYRDRFPKLIRKHIHGHRFYHEKNSDILYPSVTTVIQHANHGKFDEWEQRKGIEEANRIRKRATTRGDRLHKVIETYLQNKDHTALDEWRVPLIQLMFPAIKWHLDTRVDNIYAQEIQMFSRKLKVAGTPDLIAEIDKELAIGDFKGSGRPKPREWMEDYFIQMSAYWAMFSEFTGIVPRKLVVFVICEDGTIQIEEVRDIMNYLVSFNDYLKNYNDNHPIQSANGS